ncbi:hypothetical protein ACJ72_05756 [Emergomyces africanus]|uniref:PQ loop repeat protein n=1 Tax=Emergomyces africanus TaxID=1955775 RepID=A0A1B7NT85_9EURO|nr:hypothetical protein ACJ72_05756 [Emergomyces africanus]
MPEGEKIPVAANVLGTIGTVLWCVQLAPQIWHNWRNKKTDGLPASMMFLWALCAVPFGVYMILQQVPIPIQIQPQMFGSLCTICWAQILYYSQGYSLRKAVLAGVLAAALFGGSEALFILTLRIPYSKGITWPALLFGIIAAVLVTIGLIPPYFELWKRQGRVIGISWFFLSMDTLGALFSLLALAAEGTFDILGGIVYIVVLLLELGIFTSHLIWRFRFRELREAAKTSGMSIDEFLERSSNNRGFGVGRLQNGGEEGPTVIEARKCPDDSVTAHGSSEAVPG